MAEQNPLAAGAREAARSFRGKPGLLGACGGVVLDGLVRPDDVKQVILSAALGSVVPPVFNGIRKGIAVARENKQNS